MASSLYSSLCDAVGSQTVVVKVKLEIGCSKELKFRASVLAQSPATEEFVIEGKSDDGRVVQAFLHAGASVRMRLDVLNFADGIDANYLVVYDDDHECYYAMQCGEACGKGLRTWVTIKVVSTATFTYQ